ncbi:GlxA family transcriptional regulator [Mesorhizobium kowhaii]|uniref:AraC family transcriptional regulator n=1 Tax=Mesorhizobium kowhaii TaxID=1300272 RepID=A0A2W7DTI6_9HYPH|nr:GlxA family transcriptional regulator [Mesorhizobium kowhaii]PZV34586.1 AraC family transcriptional regulator [Mesorhizobium kowhaii]
MKKIAILAMPGVQLLDVIGPSDVFAEVNRKLGYVYYQIEIVGTKEGPILGSSGVRLVADSTIAQPAGDIDTLLIAGNPLIQDHPVSGEILDWVRSIAERTPRVGSVCSGAFVLAEAGLLDGLRATTHWSQADEFARRFPSIRLEPDRIFTSDGKLWTSAGVTAGIDLALALVERDVGRQLALSVARELVVFLKRPGGQSQFSTHFMAQIAQKTPIRAAQEFINNNLSHDLAVPALAAQVGMSERNFARMFKHEVQMTPGQYVEAVRLEAARCLVEDAKIPMKTVAMQSGFGDVITLRRAFVRHFAISPTNYRKSFSR